VIYHVVICADADVDIESSPLPVASLTSILGQDADGEPPTFEGGGVEEVPQGAESALFESNSREEEEDQATMSARCALYSSTSACLL
jgi:hypothetical protein